MWSGPRNISTAMMRAWDARGDTAVWDEPLYAHYLKTTGLDHPGADEIIARHESDWRRVVERCLGPVPDGRPIFYQKHMAHHLTPDVDLDWIDGLTNCFLIRDPREMLVSLAKVIDDPDADATGLPQQVRLFERECDRLGEPPPVLDARDVLEDPAGRLRALCARIGVPFTAAMLAWPAGPRETDGVWAKHWYANVERSTGFAPYRPRDEAPPEHLHAVLERCRALYDQLHQHRMT